MEDLEEIYGFPVFQEKENMVIDTNCNYPQQSSACKRLFVALESIKLEDENIIFPLKVKRWSVIIDPTEENIIQYFSMRGIMRYIEQYHSRLKDTITFFKPEVYFPSKYSLPVLTLHFYELNYEGRLNISNAYQLSNLCMIDVRDIKITPYRLYELEKYNIDVDWFKHLPFLPMELIKFDETGNIMEFQHQKLNTKSTNEDE
jgi:hypothetical protein